MVASPAQDAGFQIGDRIVAVDGRHFSNWAEVSAYIQAQPGQRLDVTVDRDGKLVHLFPVPVNRNDVQLSGAGTPSLPRDAPGAAPVGFIGIVAQPRDPLRASGGSLSRAGGAWVHVNALTLDAFGRLFTLHGASSYLHMLSNQKAADNPGNGVRFESPVGIVRLLHQAGQSGLPPCCG